MRRAGVPTIAVQVSQNPQAPDCWLLTFECPHCWRYGGSHGSGDVDAAAFAPRHLDHFFYRRRPKRARPVTHTHGGAKSEGPNHGHRIAHCWEGSPFYETGYYLVEDREPSIPKDRS